MGVKVVVGGGQRRRSCRAWERGEEVKSGR